MKQITKQLKCVVLNGNIEKWLEAEKAEIIAQAVKNGDKFVEISGELINTFSIVGIFNAHTMSERTRRKNGEWQCEHGMWWGRGDKSCSCLSLEERNRRSQINAMMIKKYPHLAND